MVAEHNADSSLRKAAKLVPAALVGGFVGFFGMRYILRAGDSGMVFPDGSVIAAIAITVIYAVLAIVALVGMASPKLGVAMKMYVDEQEWVDEQPMMRYSAISMAALLPVLPLLLLFDPYQLLSFEVTAALLAVCVIVTVWATVGVWREMDELWRDVSMASGNIGFYTLFAIGGLWSVLAHLGLLSPLSAIDWITLFYAVALVAILGAAQRRGLLEEDA